MKRYSGKFVVRLPVEVHERLSEISSARGVSLNSLCAAKLGEVCAGVGSVHGSGESKSEIVPWVLAEFSGVVAVVLFGSEARGEQTESSDIDLLIVCDPTQDISRDMYRRWDKRIVPRLAENMKLRKITPHFVILPRKPLEAGGLWYEVALDGKIVWEKNASTSHFLCCVREAMAAGQIQRQLAHGHPYWVKKATNEK